VTAYAVAAPPFDATAWLDRALATLALRLRHEVALTRALRGADRQESFLGLFVTDDEAEAILAEAAGRLRVSGTAAAAAEIVALERRLAADRLADPGGIWSRLADRCGLGEPELDLVLLAAAPALDPRIGRVYGYLNDDLARRHLTPALALRLLDRHGVDLATLRRMLARGAPLRAAGLVSVGPERPLVEAALRVEDDVLDHLLGHDAIAPELADRCDVVATPRGGAPVCPVVWLLDGPDAGGDALSLGGRLGADLLVVDAEHVSGHVRARGELVAACVREARLLGALPVLTGFDACPAAERREIATSLAAPAVVVTARPALWADPGLAATPGAPPDPTSRLERIEALLCGHPADSAALRAWLGRLRRLDLLHLARLLARHRDEPALRATVKAHMSRGLAGLAEPLVTQVTLDDLVLPARARAALQTLVGWQETDGTVLEEWGLGRLLGKRPGTVALFKGPSGTGKTMAACATAAALDLPLHRVNLAGLVSKYIGETEKNLDRLFAAAEAADVVLFFDEADAMFGRRSEVQDARDRYANLETAYLLQRLETHCGIAILASNLHQNIDDAFLRRIDLVVEFAPPAAAARRAIWRRIGAGAAPLDPDVDLDLLAESFDLTGGEIRNCWLSAAHAAAARGAAIDTAALMAAVGRELTKAGKPIRRAAFGPHYAALRLDEDPR
jgi:AAA+ superfamily predicted ATPase